MGLGVESGGLLSVTAVAPSAHTHAVCVRGVRERHA